MSNEKDYKFQYMLLGRLIRDVEYFLGFGSLSNKHLYMGNIDDQITKMKEIYNLIPNDIKPQWIDISRIDKYEKDMKKAVLNLDN